METKVLQVFYGKDCLPYKDKERSVHFPIVGAAIQGASNTTKIRFYFDELVEEDDQTTTWVVVSKLPNGKIGSEIVETQLDSELNEHYAQFSVKNFYTQAKGDLFLSLQGYQGGVQVETDPSTGISQIIGTPTIQATGSIKLAINYATQLVGSGETANINFQKILADLGTKLGIRAYTERVTELPTVGETNVFYAIYDDTNDPNKLNIYVWNGTTQSYVWVGDNTLYLGEYYTKEQGEQFESGIDNRVTSVENELTSIASGSPKGVYDTVSDLTTANPNHDYIYLVLADGKWYYWSSSSSAWTAGGIYQASEGNVFVAAKLLPPYSGFINYNTTSNQIELPQYTMIIKPTGARYETNVAINVSIPSGTSAMVMIFNWSTNTFSIVAYTSLSTYANSSYSIVMTIRTTTHQLGCDCAFTVDGKPFGWNLKVASNSLGSSTDTPIAQDIVNKKFNERMLDIFFYPNAYPSIVSSTRKITFPAGTRFFGFDFNYSLESDVVVDLLPISTTSVSILVIDINTKVISSAIYNLAGNTSFADKRYIGTVIIQINGQWSVRLACPYYYNGVLYGTATPEQTSNGTYQGAKFPSKVNKFYYESFMSISYSGSDYTSQDIDVWNGVLYVALNPGKIRLYDMSTKTLITELSVDISHANSLQFSKTYYDENDTIPLLYCGYENYVSVIRITESGGTYSATLLYKLKFSNIGYYASPYFDFENGIMWEMGYKEQTWGYTNTNGMILNMYNLNNLTDNGDGTYTPELISTIESPYVGTTQGRKFYQGKLYMEVSGTSSPHNSKLLCLNPYTGIVESTITDMVSGMTELEGICFYIENNDIYWLVSDYYNFKKVKFFD